MPREDQIEKIIAKIMKLTEDFSLNELLELRFDIEERVIAMKEAMKEAGIADKPITVTEPTITVREQMQKCGKATCHCNNGGALHGPYIYHYWKEGGKTKSKYIRKA